MRAAGVSVASKTFDGGVVGVAVAFAGLGNVSVIAFVSHSTPSSEPPNLHWLFISLFISLFIYIDLIAPAPCSSQHTRAHGIIAAIKYWTLGVSNIRDQISVSINRNNNTDLLIFLRAQHP